ncbi:MAG TPA: hypothetical protein VEU62_14935 [Bryobacterales bacterium]|nr:hypothetical protein [Bryobacterales bacterium]
MGNGYEGTAFGGDFGIGVYTSDNVIEDNIASGNTNGINVGSAVNGNVIRRNLAVGNPAVQVSVDHVGGIGHDINNMAAPGKNLFDGNICVTGVNAPCPVVSPRSASLLESELQYLGCGAYPPTPSCQLSVSEWNWYLTNKVNPAAQVLVIGDGTQQMTVQQYIQARADAGLF